MNNKDISLTDKIYKELVDGLKTGLDWTAFIAKHSASKGPLYNAIGRFFNDMESKVKALGAVQAKFDAAGLKLDQLDRGISEADKDIQAKNHDLALLEEKENTLKKQSKALEGDLEQKIKFLEQLQELEKSGFGEERLKTLRITLVNMGTKRGLKRDEAVNTFFTELKDYDSVQGFTQELQRLETVIRTKTLEAEKWQAEADNLSRHHKDLSEAIAAVQSLIKSGVKAEQIVSWNGLVSNLGGPEELQDQLELYKSMSELLAAKKKETEDYDKRVIELGAQVRALNEQKVEIEGAIKSLSTSGVKKITEVSDKAMSMLKSLSNGGSKEITKVSDKAMTALRSLSNGESKEITRVSDKAITGLKPLLEEIRAETKRWGKLKGEAGKLEEELRYARYITTDDQAALKAFPKEVVIAFLDKALAYCKLNKLNPKVRAPDGFSSKNYFISPYAEVDLLDLIAWAENGLEGASQ